mgnify:CR=1 FL=1
MSSDFNAKRVSIDIVSPKVDEKTENEFFMKVRELLDYSFRCKSLVKPLLKTEKTFRNSAADIYLYIKDDEICSSCTRGYSLCPKAAKGYRLYPRYDEDIDAIVMDKIPCEYLRNKQRTLNNIFPCDCQYDRIYNESSLLLRQIQNRKSSSELKDSETLVNRILFSYREFSSEKKNKGIVFYSPSAPVLADRLLMFACFLFASKGIKTSYVKMDSLFRCLNDKDFQVSDMAKRDYSRLLSVPVLCLEKLNLFERRFFSEDCIVNYLYPLLKKRNENGKITFASLNQDKAVSYLANSWFYHLDQQAEAREDMDEIFEKKRIRDISID